MTFSLQGEKVLPLSSRPTNTRSELDGKPRKSGKVGNMSYNGLMDKVVKAFQEATTLAGALEECFLIDKANLEWIKTNSEGLKTRRTPVHGSLQTFLSNLRHHNKKKCENRGRSEMAKEDGRDPNV